jgi:hypothetical protein
MTLQLATAWSARLKLRAEGDKLRAEGDKLWAEGAKIWAEGDKLWAEAVISSYGNIMVSWSWRTRYGECTLENGDVYDETTIVEAAHV